MDNYRINNLMDKAKLDVIVLFSAENIFYLTQSPTVLRLKDFQQTRPNSSRLIITIKEKNKCVEISTREAYTQGFRLFDPFKRCVVLQSFNNHLKTDVSHTHIIFVRQNPFLTIRPIVCEIR